MSRLFQNVLPWHLDYFELNGTSEIAGNAPFVLESQIEFSICKSIKVKGFQSKMQIRLLL